MKILPEMYLRKKRTDNILKVIRLWIRIWEFFEGFVNIVSK